MSDAFADLGLRAQLSAAATQHGFDAPAMLQRAAIPVLRRGGNVVLHASYGAGVTAAYGLALIDRIADEDEADGPRVLVITPTAARAARAADELSGFGAAVGVPVRALAPGWRDAESAAIVIGALENVAGALGRSALKLDGVRAVVIEALSVLLADGGADALETVLAAVPREAQRVIATPVVDAAVQHFIESHARRPLHVPARAADPATQSARQAGEAHYLVVSEDAKADAVARLLVRAASEEVLVTTRSTRRAAEVRALLAARGYAPDDKGALRVSSATEAPPRGARVIAYDVPMDVETLTHLHTGEGVILATAGELAHLRRLAEEAHVTLRPEKVRAADRDIGAAFRAEVRRALDERDLDAHLLLLEPLFEEHSPAEVAAALSSLLRERRAGGARAERVTAPAAEESAQPSAPATFTRLFLSIGSRDNIRPGDLVGAITGEAGITGSEVGRIDLRDTFSVVEVAADAAERVIHALNGTTMRGRSLRVDYDRRTTGPARSAARPRRTRPRAPGEGP